jgi:hypothetical protein
MKSYRGNRGKFPLILTFSVRKKQGVIFTLGPLHTREKSPRYSFDGMPQNRRECDGEENNLSVIYLLP